MSEASTIIEFREEPSAAALCERGVVVAHPGRQHTYETVRAAQAHGVLRQFATGVYLSELSHLGRGLARLSRFPRCSALVTVATRRFDPVIESSKVVSFPFHQLVARLARPVPYAAEINRWADRRCDARIARWLAQLEPSPALVHGFEGGALATFRSARAADSRVVLDVPGAHEYAQAVLAEEGARVAPVALTRRVHAERELADLLLAPSEFVRACLVENGVAPERIALVPYGVDIERFAPAGERDDGVFRVLFVGFVSHRKGFRYLLEAWRRLALPRAELVVVGGADGYGRSLLARCPSCTWLGNVPRSAVHECFARSDVFVLPSLCEGSALVTYEAMASAIPVVTTPNSGSVVRDGTDGLLVPPRDVDGLCEAIEHLYRHPGPRREMGAQARAHVESSYTWAHYADRLIAAYDSVFV